MEFLTMSKYTRVIRGEEIDVYDILEAYKVNHPIGHAIKKLLMAGDRGSKSKLQDLLEARESLDRAIVDERDDEEFSEELRGPDHE